MTPHNAMNIHAKNPILSSLAPDAAKAVAAGSVAAKVVVIMAVNFFMASPFGSKLMFVNIYTALVMPLLNNIYEDVFYLFKWPYILNLVI